MARNLFSVPIFFIVFRETLEAAIIVSVLLGLAEQIVHDDNSDDSRAPAATTPSTPSEEDKQSASEISDSSPAGNDAVQRRRLVRKLRIQASDLWSKSEELWEGIFELIASLMIFVMGITMLKMDRAKAKWRVKLSRAFEGKQADGKARTGKWVLFILPLITVLREGLEAVIFVGGVSLGQPATSIPIAAIVGLVCGFACGLVIYEFASRSTLTIFLVVMTNFLMLIGAGLFSKAVGAFQENAFNRLLGADVDDAGGDGPGSYLVQGNVWHLDCCNPDSKFDGEGWTIFGAIFGWTNNATLGTVLSYVFYWLAVIVALIYIKFKEGRTTLMGQESAAGVRRRRAREIKEIEANEKATESPQEGSSPDVATLPR
ncbi:High affinity iron permease ftrA [Psilocybe cubensis]|uniref:High affinity iron permease ftrA n=1 Tax=Psilocybe cubensis TaxID=181762 RepID=A0ACB8GR49_PSICU|nr:High affinity iron permease ftrA [Psilocybe cubensis]KAH9478003.1 High affinity iron permease ftrA [Psilocybe cubensis]